MIRSGVLKNYEENFHEQFAFCATGVYKGKSIAERIEKIQNLLRNRLTIQKVFFILFVLCICPMRRANGMIKGQIGL